jgi:ELWxxDGT repeat protein
MAENVVLFQGVNGSNETGLWETNGTTSGTFELAPIGGADASGVSPLNLVAFNGEALFDGVNASGVAGLWVTNGTAAGTHEVTNIAGNPGDLTVFGSEVRSMA